jgi:hypothetical protein
VEKYELEVKHPPITFNATKSRILPWLVEDFEEEVIDPILVRRTYEVVDECLEIGYRCRRGTVRFVAYVV